MKTFLILLVFIVTGLMLFESNPKSKRRYIKYVARYVQSLCCNTASAVMSDPDCRRLRPITQPIVEGISYLHTDVPKDSVFFTCYTTRLPNQTLHGIGIAGQFVSYPDRFSHRSWLAIPQLAGVLEQRRALRYLCEISTVDTPTLFSLISIHRINLCSYNQRDINSLAGH